MDDRMSEERLAMIERAATPPLTEAQKRITEMLAEIRALQRDNQARLETVRQLVAEKDALRARCEGLSTSVERRGRSIHAQFVLCYEGQTSAEEAVRIIDDHAQTLVDLALTARKGGG